MGIPLFSIGTPKHFSMILENSHFLYSISYYLIDSISLYHKIIRVYDLNNPNKSFLRMCIA